MGELVRVEDVDGGIRRLILNRPDQFNALSWELLWELDRLLMEAADDTDVRVILLSGEGKHFSAGHDISAGHQARKPPTLQDRTRNSYRIYVDLSLRWRDIPKPTIAAVHGYCIFGGWMVASAMDILVVADDAQMLPGLFQYFAVPWDLGIRRTKEILFETRFISGTEAVDIGYANRAVPSARLETEALAMAGRIAETDPFITRMVKQTVHQAQDAMGFTASVKSAHASYMLVEQSGVIMPREGGPRRLAPVDQALRKLKAERGETT